jgi:hypothetical protein
MIKRRNKKNLRTDFIKKSKFGVFNIKVFWGLSIFLFIGLISCVISQTNFLAEKSQVVSRFQTELAELSEGNIENSFSSQKTLELAQVAQDLNFEKINKVYYIKAIGSTALAE